MPFVKGYCTLPLLNFFHLLSSVQNATGVQDLGVLYYKAFKDAHGSILLLTINDIKVDVV